MNTPCGSDQVLSLAWALENVTDFNRKDAVSAVCELVGIPHSEWEGTLDDRSWFIGDPRWHNREQIEALWNERFAKLTRVWLDEDVWHLPLWHLWLTVPKMVFAANLRYLIDLGGQGTVKRLAAATGHQRTTASKWGHWVKEGKDVRIPQKSKVPAILEFFGLKPTCDLFVEPLFLGQGEIHDAVLRIEGKHYLDSLTGTHLSQAVEHLRAESARQVLRRRGGED